MKIERGYYQHVGSRNEQQDAGLVLADDGRAEQLIVVADGMGGHAGGSIASAQVAETAKRIWSEHQKTPIEPKRLLERIIREGHESINRAGAEKGLTPRSTCALLFLRNGDRSSGAHWAHIGDSRIYRLRDGQVSRLTRDHSVVQMLVDLGKVSEEEMGTHPDQNRLTQSLGGEAQPMPDFGNDSVKTHDAFLVCSDGLWEMIPQAEMASALAAKKLGDDGAKHLADRAFDRAKPKSDNITVALLRVGGPPPGGIGAADPEDAKTTRMPGLEPRRAARGGGKRWAFLAATLVAVAAAAAVVYKPWDKQGLDTGTTPATGPKDKPPEQIPPRTEPPKTEPPKVEPPKIEPPKTEPPKTEVPKTDPPKPDVEPKPAVRPPEVTPPKDPPPAPETPRVVPPGGPQPAPGPAPAPPPGDRGDKPPAKPEPPASGGAPEKKETAPKPAPARPQPASPPRGSGLEPDAKKPETPPANTDKPPEPKPQ